MPCFWMSLISMMMMMMAPSHLFLPVSDNPSDCAPHTEGGSSSRGRRVVVGEDPARSGPSSVVGGDHHVWFYEGHAGWWQYDERTSDEIERAFVERLSACELSIAGFLYTIDFKSLTQVRVCVAVNRLGWELTG